MNAGPDGEDMSMKVFRRCIEFDTHITLGGGEPTLHKKFLEMLMEAVAECEYVWLATNGSNTKISLLLAKLAKSGVIGCALSQDYYHDGIDERVVDAFTKSENSYNDGDHQDQREIRNVTKVLKYLPNGRKYYDEQIMPHGRALENQIYSHDLKDYEKCACEELFVKPNGDVHMCGCEDSLFLGNIMDKNFTLPEDYEHDTCYHTWLKDKEEESA